MRSAMSTMMTMTMLIAGGCGQADATLPLLDPSGDLAGSFHPASGELRVGDDPSAVENQDGDQIAVVDGLATVDWVLLPGDEVLLVDAAGEVLEALTVEEPEAIDGLSDDDARTRFPGCYPVIQ